MRHFLLVGALAASLTACGAGKAFLTPDVQSVARTAANACVTVLTGGPQLSALQAQGFEAFRGGYLRTVPNPEIIAGDSRVAATIRGGECIVEVWPATANEMSTLRAITQSAIASRGAPLTARYAFGGSRGAVVANISRP